MEARSIIAKFLLTAFILTAVFGLYTAALSPIHHDTECPFSLGSLVVCDAALLHLSHWQNTFVAVAAELLVLVAAIFVFFTLNRVIPNILGPTRWRLTVATPLRPTLLQEFFSSGILNPKKPHHA